MRNPKGRASGRKRGTKTSAPNRAAAFLFLLSSGPFLCFGCWGGGGSGGGGGGGGSSTTQHALTVTLVGAGTVTSFREYINCPGACLHSYDAGSGVTITAAPAQGYTFQGWSGACSGSDPVCTLTMNSDLAVTATFTPQTNLLGIHAYASTGSGTVTSAPPGINCTIQGGSLKGACSNYFAIGSTVTLTETPAPGATFLGWGDACSGTGACSVTIDPVLTLDVIAMFSSVTGPILTVSTAGTNGGTVSSSPAGISNCGGGGECSAAFTTGSSVTLTATPASGWTFSGWSGACTGSGATCTFTIDADANITATFTATAKTYSGPLAGSFGTFSGCGGTYSGVFSGTLGLSLTEDGLGNLGGTGTVDGKKTTTAISCTLSGGCSGGSGTWTETGAISGTASQFSVTVTDKADGGTYPTTFTFTGSLGSGSASGSVTASHTFVAYDANGCQAPTPLSFTTSVSLAQQ